MFCGMWVKFYWVSTHGILTAFLICCEQKLYKGPWGVPSLLEVVFTNAGQPFPTKIKFE